MRFTATIIATIALLIALPAICAESTSVELRSPQHELPPLSTIDGEIITGGYASAYGQPTPILIKTTLNAQLPNGEFLSSAEKSDCFLLAYAEGLINQNRAMLTLTKLTCTTGQGRVMETSKINGYVNGKDGLSGVEGKVVTTEGAVIGRAFLDEAAKEVSRNAHNDSTASLGFYNFIQSYKNMAAPVVKIEPNTRVVIVLTKPLDLSYGPTLLQPTSTTKSVSEDIQHSQFNNPAGFK